MLRDPSRSEGLPDELRLTRMLSLHYMSNYASVHVWNRGGYNELEIGYRTLVEKSKHDFTCRDDYPEKMVWIAGRVQWEDPSHYYYRPTPAFIHHFNVRETHFLRIPVMGWRKLWTKRIHPRTGAGVYAINKKYVDFWPITGQRIPRGAVEFRENPTLDFNPEHEPENQNQNE